MNIKLSQNSNLVSITLSGSDKLSVGPPLLGSASLRKWFRCRLINKPMPSNVNKSTIGTVTPTIINVLSLSERKKKPNDLSILYK